MSKTGLHRREVKELVYNYFFIERCDVIILIDIVCNWLVFHIVAVLSCESVKKGKKLKSIGQYRHEVVGLLLRAFSSVSEVTNHTI